MAESFGCQTVLFEDQKVFGVGQSLIKLISFFVLFFFMTLVFASELKLANVPPEIISKCLDGFGKIADINQAWDPTCIPLKDGVPKSKFIFSCEDKGTFFLVCAKGGYDVFSEIHQFEKNNLQKWSLVQSNYKRGEVKDLNCKNVKMLFEK